MAIANARISDSGITPPLLLPGLLVNAYRPTTLSQRQREQRGVLASDTRMHFYRYVGTGLQARSGAG